MTKRYNKKHEEVITAADVLREKNTAAMFLRLGDAARAAQHTAQAQAYEKAIEAKKTRHQPPAPPAPISQVVTKAPRLEMFLLVKGFMDGQLVVQRLEVRPDIILALQHDIGSEAFAAESGTVIRDLKALRRPLTEKELDRIEQGLHACVLEAMADKPRKGLRLVDQEPRCFGKEWNAEATECNGGHDPTFTAPTGGHTRPKCDLFDACRAKVQNTSAATAVAE